MSFTRKFTGRGKNNAPIAQPNEFQTSPLSFQLLPRNPMVYSQSPSIRYQMTESEPLSEYTEIPMTLTRAMPPPSQLKSPQHQASMTRMMPQSKSWQISLSNSQQMFSQSPSFKMTHQQNIQHPAPLNTACVKDFQPQTMVYNDVRFSPYHRPSQLLPPSSPQCFVTQYNPEQTFVMQSMTPSSAVTIFPSETRNGNSSSTLVKSNNSTSRGPSKRTKLSSVNRKRLLYGSIDQVVRWHKKAKETNMYTIYEVAAILDNVSHSPTGVYRMILRDDQKNNILPLQAVFYPIDRELPTVRPGELITCVGRMVGTNKLQVFDMWSSLVDSLVGIKRISFLCQRTLQEVHLRAPEP